MQEETRVGREIKEIKKECCMGEREKEVGRERNEVQGGQKRTCQREALSSFPEDSMVM